MPVDMIQPEPFPVTKVPRPDENRKYPEVPTELTLRSHPQLNGFIPVRGQCRTVHFLKDVKKRTDEEKATLKTSRQWWAKAKAKPHAEKLLCVRCQENPIDTFLLCERCENAITVETDDLSGHFDFEAMKHALPRNAAQAKKLNGMSTNRKDHGIKTS